MHTASGKQGTLLDLYKLIAYTIAISLLYQGLADGLKKFLVSQKFFPPPMKNGPTKGESETAIRNAVIKFEQEFMGRGPTEVKAFILRDMVLVRLKGVLTLAERQLAKNVEGVDMVKRMRQNLIAQGREQLCNQITAITGVEVTGLFTDIETHSGERMIVFTLENDLDNTFR